MSVQQVKEDLDLIATLTASTAGFLKHQVNGMMVGDSQFIKAEMKPHDVIAKAKNSLITEYNNTNSTPIFQNPVTPELPTYKDFRQPELTSTRTVNNIIDVNIANQTSEPLNQLQFNFDNTPTAQNIYCKLNYIVERLDKLSERVNNLSEQIIKKKLVKKA